MGMEWDELENGQISRRKTTGLGCYSQVCIYPFQSLTVTELPLSYQMVQPLTRERINKAGSTTDYTEWPFL